MSIVIGIDVGISSTKIIGIESGKRIRSSMDSTASDPLTAAYGAIGKFIHKNDLTVNDVEHIMATGVGAKRLKTPILDIPTTPVDEFLANGRGARFDTGLWSCRWEPARRWCALTATTSGTSAAWAWVEEH